MAARSRDTLLCSLPSGLRYGSAVNLVMDPAATVVRRLRLVASAEEEGLEVRPEAPTALALAAQTSPIDDSDLLF